MSALPPQTPSTQPPPSSPPSPGEAAPGIFDDRSSLDAALAEWCADPAIATAKHGNISTSWNVSAIVDMSFLLEQAPCGHLFNEDINAWDVARVTNLAYAFSQAHAFNQPLDAWDTGNVVDMEKLFCQASAFDQALDSWDTARATNMRGLFSSATTYNHPLAAWSMQI